MELTQEKQEFVDAYVECALWSSTDESDESGGDPMDDNYDESDIAPEAMAKMQEDCLDFINADQKIYIL